MIKDTNKQQDEEIHMERSGGVGAWSWGAITLPMWMHSLTWKLSETPTTGIL